MPKRCLICDQLHVHYRDYLLCENKQLWDTVEEVLEETEESDDE